MFLKNKLLQFHFNLNRLPYKNNTKGV